MDTAHDPRFWRGLAAKAHTAAASLTDRELRLQMLAIAAAYREMAERAQALGKPMPISMRSAPLPKPANNNRAA